MKVGWLRTDPANKFAIKTMKKAEIVASKHVDHIENEKKILESVTHPFTVSKKKDITYDHQLNDVFVV